MSKPDKMGVIHCVSFAAVLGFFPALQSYLPQPEEFRIGLITVGFFATLIFVMTAGLLLGIDIFLKSHFPRAEEYFLVAIRCLTVAIFVQFYLFDWRYGPLGRREIVWAQYRYGLIDTTFWITCLFFGFRFRKAFLNIYPRLAFAILLYSSFVAIISFVQHSGHHRYVSGPMQEDNIEFRNTFSKDKNVIVVLLDGFQGNTFQELIEEHPELKNDFSDFTYFRNSTACHAYTKPSVPNILSGERWDGKTSWDDLGPALIATKFMPRDLKRNGYLIDLFLGAFPAIETDVSEGPPTYRKSPVRWFGRKLARMAYVYDFALFRIVPHYAKKIVMNDLDWFLSGHAARYIQSPVDLQKLVRIRSDEDLHELKRNGRLDDFYFLAGLDFQVKKVDENVFKFFHLMGSHYPWVLDNNFEVDLTKTLNPKVINDSLVFGSPQELRTAQKKYKNQCYAYLKLVRKSLFDKLKVADLWDNSMIFLLADHGVGADGFFVRASEKFQFPVEKAAGIPLLLVKPFGVHGALKTSNAPVELGDVPKTVFKAIGVSAPDYRGRDIFSISENEKRKRYFSVVNLHADEGPRKLSYEGNFPIYEFEIDGFSWDDSSWKVSRVVR